MPIIRGVICDNCGVMMYWCGNVSKQQGSSTRTERRVDDRKTVSLRRLSTEKKRESERSNNWRKYHGLPLKRRGGKRSGRKKGNDCTAKNADVS